jgi:hypothetical protein
MEYPLEKFVSFYMRESAVRTGSTSPAKDGKTTMERGSGHVAWSTDL